MSIFWYVLVGLLSGIVSGMGIGGGAILIPALTLFMDIGQQKAQNINLLYFIPTAIIALFVHKKNNNIEKKGLLPLILWALPGAVAGAIIAVNIDANYLRKGFAIFLLCMAVYELWKGFSKWKSQRSNA
ncbi:MAG: sulfite exporter TauE/SafE family protein [Defluviitaleaceae bacterium]|nr:sulfite exporter TauE/SafE family protein [Defluviitaleaceae bacterium]